MLPISRQDRHGWHISVCHREGALVPPGSLAAARKAVCISFDGGRLTSDAGVLVLAEIERRLGIAERLARCIPDLRAPGRVHHGIAEMIRFRILLIAAGHPDANDCDALRSDPAFKVALGRLPGSGADLCSQPTMSRLENLPTPTALSGLWCLWSSCSATASARCRAGLCSILTIRRTAPMAASNLPSFTPTITAAAFCRSTSMRRSPAGRSW